MKNIERHLKKHPKRLFSVFKHFPDFHSGKWEAQIMSSIGVIYTARDMNMKAAIKKLDDSVGADG